MNSPLAAAVGVVADRVLGEPPAPVHPLAGFGALMRAAERPLYADARPVGALHAALGTAVGAGAGWCLDSAATSTWLAVGGRGLCRTATDVARTLEADDLDRARRILPALVGRDVEDLDETEIARAAVESVAENTVDAVVAPAVWAAVAGGPGALGYRAVNTLDAMVGCRSERYRHYGWASARLDDMAGWVPARLTAVLVTAVRPRAAADVWTAVRRQAPAHPSPNAGVAEAAFAAALGLRLGGESSYGGRVETRPSLGTGRPPEPADIVRAVRLCSDVSVALAAGLAAVGLYRRCARRGHA